MIKLLIGYWGTNKILFSIIIIYGVLLLLNAMGVPVWLPSCPFSAYLGIECFGCGINRAFVSLLRFDIQQAWEFNPLIFIYLPLLVFWICYDFYKYSKRQTIF